MNTLRMLSRLALSWVFLYSGVDVIRNPQKPANTAGWLLAATRSGAPVPMPDDHTMVQANAAVQVAGAAALALGVRPRVAAAVLAGSLLPTTAGGHAFWRFDDPVLRKAQQVQFNKNLALLGGLLAVISLPTSLPEQSQPGSTRS